MPQHVLQHNEEVLQRNRVRVQLSAALQGGLDEFLHHQLADVHQVRALDAHGVSLWGYGILVLGFCLESICSGGLWDISFTFYHLYIFVYYC